MRFCCGEFSLDVPSDWMDITEEPWPFTLSKPEGFGALQFSAAIYSTGQLPSPTIDDLSNLLSEFAESQELGKSSDHLHYADQMVLIGASFYPDEDTFIRAWYLSDGFNIGKVTYTCDSSRIGSELNEAELIVRSLMFL